MISLAPSAGDSFHVRQQNRRFIGSSRGGNFRGIEVQSWSL
jgi:hypothetical protein